jgi:hypothetical protein
VEGATAADRATHRVDLRRAALQAARREAVVVVEATTAVVEVVVEGNITTDSLRRSWVAKVPMTATG